MSPSIQGVAAWLLAPALWLSPLAAQSPSLERALPPDTILYVSMPDILTSLEELKSMPIARMWAEKEMQDFAAGMVKLVEQQFEEGLASARQAHQEGMFPLDPDQLLKLRIHGASMALTSLKIDTSSGSPMPDVGIVVHLDLGSSAPIWQQTAEFLLGLVEQQSQGMVKPVRSEVDGAIHWQVSAPEMGPLSVNVAFFGQHMVMSTREPEFQAVLAGMRAKATGDVKSLSTSPSYRAVFAHLDDQGVEMKALLQPQPLIDFMLEVLQIGMQMQPDYDVDLEGLHRVIEVLGLRNLKAMGSTWRYQDSVCVTKSFTLVPPAARKGLFAAEPTLLDKSLIGVVSEDASSFSASTFQLASIYDGIVAAMRAYDPEMASMVLEQFAEMQNNLGLDIRKDLLGSIGDQMIYWSKPVTSVGSLPALYALMDVKDEALLLKSVRSLFDLSEGVLSVGDLKRSGMQMHQLKLDLPMAGGMFDVGTLFSPFFVFHDGHMVAALSTQDVQRTANRLSQVKTTEAADPALTRPDIRSNPEFVPYRKHIEAANVYAMSFTDWKASFEGYYQLTSLLMVVPIPPAIPIDISLLPEVGSLTQHLRGAVSVSTVEKDGYLTTSVSPFGPEVYVGIGALFGVGGALGSSADWSSPGMAPVRNR